MVALVLYLGGPLLLFLRFQWVFGLILSLPGWIGVAVWVRGLVAKWLLVSRVRYEWWPDGIRCLLIYSDSPMWRDHIRERWLPALSRVAVVWNRSEGPLPRKSLVLELWHQFCRSSDSPVVLVFREEGAPEVFRFRGAFQEAKQGRGQYVQKLEDEMFAALEATRPRS